MAGKRVNPPGIPPREKRQAGRQAGRRNDPRQVVFVGPGRLKFLGSTCSSKNTRNATETALDEW